MSDDEDTPSRARPANMFMTRAQKKAALGSAYKRAPKQEKEARIRLGGQAIPASGAKFYKGDVERRDLCRVECKATEADSFRVTKAMIQTITEAAMLNNEIPYVEIEFVDARSQPISSACVIMRSDLEHLLNRLADAEGTPRATDRRGIKRPKPNPHRPT